MSVGSISSGNTRKFTNEEEEALRRDESTSTIMNRARRDAGGSGEVELRGDDKTRAEVSQEHKEHVGIGGALEIGTGVFIDAPHFIEGIDGAVAGGGVVAGAVGGLALYGARVIEMEHQRG